MTEALAVLLDRCGAPGSLAPAVAAALGPTAAALVADDPWRLLEVPGVRPPAADAAAAALGVRPDARRGAGLVVWHLRRAAADGHTVLPAAVLAPALAAHGVPDPAAAVRVAADDGRVVEVDAGVSLAALAYAEDALAHDLLRLAGGGEVSAVVAPYGSDPAELCAGLRAAGVEVVEDAERVDVVAAARRLEGLPDGARLALVGDPALLGSAGPGDVLADVVGSGAVPVVERSVTVESPLSRLVSAVRAGTLPAVSDPDRQVVVVPATDDTAVRRAVQLVTDSIPRALGIPVGDVLAVAPRRAGVAGVEALAAALSGSGAPPAQTIHAARGRRPEAAVVVLSAEAAGSLDRALVATAFALPRRHLSVVHAAGSALAEAVARVPRRPRRTRLAALLREAAG